MMKLSAQSYEGEWIGNEITVIRKQCTYKKCIYDNSNYIIIFCTYSLKIAFTYQPSSR